MAYSFEHFAVLFVKLNRHWNDIASEEMGKYDIKGKYAVYLLILKDSKEDLTASILSKIAGKDKADVSRAVKCFEENGLVKLKGDSSYRAVIKITAKGRKLIGRIETRMDEIVNEAAADVSDAQQETMLKVFDKMGKIIDDKYYRE
ncbi:MAG: MarR family winged helix-turn-helix transcriptional regulator [Erysipelotrichaceae bacterium]|nr:MarR family winged helix-turn-helix transcriptional regulator [Erysipelotrichaceae bacterium]